MQLGLEEEIFIVEDGKPHLSSLYYLAKLLKKNPRFYYTHSASNFTRGKDIKKGLMSCVEIATGVHDCTENLLGDLLARRKDLIGICDAPIVALGSLLDFDSPTNTAALQLHLSGLPDMKKAYQNLAYFLPLLTLLTANSPGCRGEYFGKSYRMASSYAIGPLKDDWEYRFQDIIFSRRLKTIELRVFDPIWDIDRLSILLETIVKIVQVEKRYSFDIEKYTWLRDEVVELGYSDNIKKLYDELSEICFVPEEFFMRSPSDEVWEFFQTNGLEATYNALDNAYRSGKFERAGGKKRKAGSLRAIIGFSGYYVPKLPYIIWKGLKEHGYL